MRLSELPLGRWLRRWWPVAADLLLALLVFVLTADQGSGTEVEVVGEGPPAMRLLLAAATAATVLVRRRTPYPLLAVGTAAWALMGAPGA